MKINSTHNIDKKRLFGVHPFLLNGWLWVFFILLGFADGLAQSPVTYTSGSGNFVVPAGVKTITVEVWGGGGKGGAVSSGGTQASPGGGGGGARKTGGNTTRVGGNGANGKIIITYEVIVSASNSSVNNVAPTKLYADNTSTSTVTIQVRNAANAAVTNLVASDFSFSNQGTGTTIEGFQHTGDGIYTFNVRTTTAQTLNMGLTVLGISLGNTGAINFIQPSSSNSTITPSSTSVLANNTSFSTLTIVVRDNNNDVISDLVEGDFEYSGESNATVYDFVNAGGGTYTFKVRNSSAQSVTIAFFVKDFSIGSSAQITFVSPTPNSGTSDVSADPTTVLANGFDFSTITAIVKDADNVPITSLGFGNFIFGNMGDAIIDENSFVHQGAGVYTFEVTNETVEQLISQ